MKKIIIITIIFAFIILSGQGCTLLEDESARMPVEKYPKIASWLAKKDKIIESGKPYDLVMSGWFEESEAEKIRANNPDALLLAGLTTSWVYDGDEWMQFLSNVSNFGKEQPIDFMEEMYLHKENGKRCAFGWADNDWDHGEIYAMDPRNFYWVEMITDFYKNVLDQPQHDGIIIDMVTEKSWCPDAISDEDWVAANIKILKEIQEHNKKGKLVIFNSGRDLSQIDEYAEYMDGYVMENAFGEWGTDFDTAFEAVQDDFIVILAPDTEDTGEMNKYIKRMRLALTLSLLFDNTYVAYDIGPRDHGDAWWFDEYDVELGEPMGDYYIDDNAYFRKFEGGVVVCSPNEYMTVEFDKDMTNVTSGETGQKFKVEKGDGKIFINAYEEE